MAKPDLSTKSPEAVDYMLGVARLTARRRWRGSNYGWMDVEDVAVELQLAVLRARDNFKPNAGVKFSTFATTTINGALLEQYRVSSRLTRGQWERKKRGDELAASELPPIPLETALECDDGDLITLWDAIRDPSPGPETLALSADWSENVRRLLTHLPLREQRIIREHLWEDRTYCEISKRLGLSESRVFQLFGQAMSRLRLVATGDYL